MRRFRSCYKITTKIRKEKFMFVTIAQLLLSLSILVVLHELGHFGAAKWFKTRVEKFYLFFNPGFSLFKVQKGETEYGIGWLPLGGYVKISGMIDESFDKEQMAEEPKPYEFRSKPAWQRLIIMIGGVTVNFILGIILFAMVMWIWGVEFIPNSAVKEGITASEMGYDMGLRDDDILVSIGDKEIKKFDSRVLTKEIVINDAKEIKVMRKGTETLIPIDEKFVGELTKYENRNTSLFHLKFPAVVKEFDEKSPAEAKKAGLKIGDEIIGVNGKPTPYFHNFYNTALGEKTENLNFQIKRNSDTLNLEYKTMFPGKVSPIKKLFGKKPVPRRRIGFKVEDESNYVDYEVEKYGFMESIPKGLSMSWEFLTDQMKAFGQMFSGKIKASESLGSFISIGKMFGSTWDWRRFWIMTASLSILLGFLNLLPIPALDGGYVMFLLFESITGIKVSDRVMEIATLIGFGLLIILMVYALGLDIMRNI